MTLFIVYNKLGSYDPLTLISDPNDNKTKHSLCFVYLVLYELGSSSYIYASLTLDPKFIVNRRENEKKVRVKQNIKNEVLK